MVVVGGYWDKTAGQRVNAPFLDMSSSTSCMKLATSGGSLWMTLSLRPSFRRFSSLKKGCGERKWILPSGNIKRIKGHWGLSF